MIERPDYVPKDFVYVVAPDGCEYWMKEEFVGNEDFFFPCQRFEDNDTDESWHTGDELKVKEIEI